MNQKLRILLVEDSPDDVALIEHLLRKEGISFVLEIVETKADYERQLLHLMPDLIISDHSLPQFNSMEALELFLKYKNHHKYSAAFVLVTGTVSEEFAVKAIQSGADDYILKDRLKRLPSAVLNALEKNKLKEQKRKEEEEKFHLLDILQKSLHEIFVVDPQTLLFQYVNDEGLRNLGYTSEEILNLTPAEIIYDYDKSRFGQVLSKVELSQKGRIYERYAVRKDGTIYPVQIHLEVIEQGQKKLFLANCLDITEIKEHEKQKELELFIQNCFNEERSLEESLQMVLENFCGLSSIPAGEVWSRDFGEHTRCYASWKSADVPQPRPGFYIAEEAFSTGELLELENLKDHPSFPENIKNDINYRGAVAYPVKTGKEITAVLILYISNIVPGRDRFICLKEGVQDKLAINIKRKKTEEELQKIFELSPDILAILGKDGYVRKINPALQKMLGYTPEEMLQRSYDDLIHPDDVHVLEQWKDAVLGENEVAYYESRWLTIEGDYRYIAWSMTPFLKGELNFAVGKDITEHKKQVESIQKQNKRLAEIAWEQSHTVRAPLTRLMACIAYLEENEENWKRMVSCIKESAHELDDIIKGIVGKTEKMV